MTNDTKPIETENQSAKPLALFIDWELYGKYLEDSDMNDAEKREFLEALWIMVVCFVDLGLGIHPIQLVMRDCCEQDQQNVGLVTRETDAVVNYLKSATLSECKHSPAVQRKAEFTASAHHNLDLVQERSPK